MNAAGEPRRVDTAWRALRLFNLYRVVLSGLFVVFVVTGNLPAPLGSYDRRLFSIIVLAYFLCTVWAQAAVEKRIGRHTWQTFAQVLLDIVAITLMMYASGGITSGFGMLLVLTIAGGSILVPGQGALLFAAIASLAVLGEEAYSWLNFYLPVSNYTHAGFLGGTYFATALLGYVLARRLRESEALSAQRALDLASLARLNEHIVQRMQSGIVALDGDGRVRLMNAAAARLLGAGNGSEGRAIAEVSAELGRQFQFWREGHTQPEDPLHSDAGGVEFLASFTGLGSQSAEGTLVFLEDAAVTRQRAQQLKLASLGRLAASIAHEIRNPLGAISHAAQLLAESPQGGEEDGRLTHIIQEHSRRVNTIVENVMNLSRRDRAAPESFAVKPWLDAFVQEFTTRFHLPEGAVATSVQPPTITVRTDPGQLHQVLWNLCENGLRYSRGNNLLELRCGIHPMTRRPYLDVIDHGPGMPAPVQEHIFEPFFTTESAGTGLGLYIAAELCEANQASLSLISNTSKGCCFRIHFAHPARRQLTGT